MRNLSDYVPAHSLVDWAKANLNIMKSSYDMTDEDIRRIVRWIGEYSYDTVYLNGDKPILRRIGIGMMLSVTLLEFPDFYMRYGLSQFN